MVRELRLLHCAGLLLHLVVRGALVLRQTSEVPGAVEADHPMAMGELAGLVELVEPAVAEAVADGVVMEEDSQARILAAVVVADCLMAGMRHHQRAVVVAGLPALAKMESALAPEAMAEAQMAEAQQKYPHGRAETPISETETLVV